MILSPFLITQKNILVSLSLIALFASCKQEGIVPDNLQGQWVGSVPFEPYPDLMQLQLISGVSADSAVYARLFYNEVDLHKVIEPTLNNGQLNFNIEFGSFKGQFSGNFEGDSLLNGAFSHNGKNMPCTLIKVESEGVEAMGDLLGYYEMKAGHIVQIEPFMIDLSLVFLSFTDFQTGKKRIAFPTGDGWYKAGEKMLYPYPTEISLKSTISEEDSIAKLLLNENGKASLEGHRLAELENLEDITVQNGDISLEGTITYPNTSAPYPLVVLVPGAGEHFRGNTYDEYVRILPYYGMATLVYDKRGHGTSTGDAASATFEELAKDLVALVEKATTLPNINADQIALVGVDQASYVIPPALSELEKVKAWVQISGAFVNMQAQELTACRKRMQADGFPEDQINEALAYQQLLFDYLEGKADSLALQEKAATLENQSWADYVTAFQNKSYVAWWRNHYQYDPKLYLENVELPVLGIFGENDLLLEADKNAELMQQLFDMENNTSKTVIFSNANHFLMLGEKRGDVQFSEISGYAPNLFNTIAEWLAKEFELID